MGATTYAASVADQRTGDGVQLSQRGAQSTFRCCKSFSSLSVLNLPSGATFNAPNLTTIFDSNITLAGGASFNTGSLSQIDSTQLAVTGGAQINNIIATSYNINRVGTYTPLSVDGVGSKIDLHTLQTLTYGAGNGGAYGYVVTATNGGAIDLSGLTTIARRGGTDGAIMLFQTASGGTINLNALTSINPDSNGNNGYTQTRFSADANGTITIGGFSPAKLVEMDVTAGTGKITLLGNSTLGIGSRVNLTSGGALELRGSFSHSMTDETLFNASGGLVQMDGGGTQSLEIAGIDSGAVNPGNNGNFGLGELEIGSDSSSPTVALLDAVDNGNRGTGGAPEALYLFGLVGSGGLKINHEATLLIGNSPVYDFQDGSWINLQSLLSPTQTIVPFTLNGSNGFLARSVSPTGVSWVSPGSGSWDVSTNWSGSTTPGPTSDVNIALSENGMVTGPSADTLVHSLAISNGTTGDTTSLSMTGPAILTVNQTLNIGTGGQLSIAGGNVNAGALTITGGIVSLTSGTLTAGSIDSGGDPTHFGWSGGQLTINGASGLLIGPGGPLGNTLTMSTGKSLTVTNTLSVSGGGTLALAGGSVSANSLALSGTLSASGATSLNASTPIVSSNGTIEVDSGTLTYAGNISGSGLTDNGAGTLLLTGANSLAGSVTINNGALTLSGAGTMTSVTRFKLNGGAALTLDNTAANLTRIAAGAALTMDNGTFRLIGAPSMTSNTSVGTITLSSGNSTISLLQGVGGQTVLTASSLSLGSKAGLDFSAPAPGSTNKLLVTGQSAGPMGAAVTVNGLDYAKYDPAAGVVPLDAGDYTSTFAPGAYVLLTASPAGNLPGAACETLTLNTDVSSVDVTQSAGTTLNVNGILKHGINTASISGGTITSGNGMLRANVSGAALTINSALSNTSLIVSGGGTLVLTSTDATNDNFNGGIYLNGGTVQIASDANLGASVNNTNSLFFDGGTLATTGSFSIGANRTMTIDTGGGTLNVAAATTLTSSTTGQLVGSGLLTKSEAPARSPFPLRTPIFPER